MDRGQGAEGPDRQFLCHLAPFGVCGERGLQQSGESGGRLGVRTEQAHRFVGAAAERPAVDLAEGAAVDRGGVQPAPQEGLRGVGRRRVDAGLRPYGGEERGGAGGRTVGLFAAGRGGPVEPGRGVAEVAGVVDEDRAELGPGVLRLGPDAGVGRDDEHGAVRLADGLDGGGPAGGGGAVEDEGVRGEGTTGGRGVAGGGSGWVASAGAVSGRVASAGSACSVNGRAAAGSWRAARSSGAYSSGTCFSWTYF